MENVNAGKKTATKITGQNNNRRQKHQVKKLQAPKPHAKTAAREKQQGKKLQAKKKQAKNKQTLKKTCEKYNMKKKITATNMLEQHYEHQRFR